MPSDPIAPRYIALIARRPELAAYGLEVKAHYWLRYERGFANDEAHALILAHLLAKLPPGKSLTRHDEGENWGVDEWDADPLSALFAFWEAQP